VFLGNFQLFGLSPVWSWVLIGVSVVAVTVLGLVLRRRSKRYSPGPVPLFSTIPELNKAIEFTGFAYDNQQNIFYSMLNAWQRDFGYCRFYDEAAAALSMIIDCEPIYFDYDGKHWLIEFWKGQYGMTTGGEVGIYYTEDDQNDLLDWNGRLYKCVPDSELVDMYHTLYKNGRPLYTRQDKHWWLTGFVLGEFSEPEELTMIIRLTFKNIGMRDAFLQGLRKAGYRPHEYRVKGLSVAIQFSKPHGPKPLTRNKITDSMTQRRNRELCELYQKITGPYTTIVEKMNALRRTDEKLFNQAINLGKQRELFQSLNKIKGEKETANVNNQKT
jgi:hypothetical protein